MGDSRLFFFAERSLGSWFDVRCRAGLLRTVCGREGAEARSAVASSAVGVGGVFWIAQTGTAWRDLHSHFGTWNSVYLEFRRRTQAGIWDVILEAFNETGAGNDSVQIIDSTIIRAHQHAAGAQKSMWTRVLAVLVLASRPRSTSAITPSASPSRLR
ncbi:transposase [Devosia sp.]|uniref:transposase n=1 Tax=Devosia sp. TaxID=1871048 RepID=UPI0035264930